MEKEKEKEKENDWDLFIDLEDEINDKSKIITNDKNNIGSKNNLKNVLTSYPSQLNKIIVKQNFYYHYTIEKYNDDCENDFFKNRQIKEQNKYLGKMMNYKLKTK